MTKRARATKKLYGLDNKTCEVFARQCLTARRLVERGVRFVQIFAGKNSNGDGAVNDVPWDGHSNIEKQSSLLRGSDGSTRSGLAQGPHGSWFAR